MCLTQFLILIGRLYLSAMWLCVAPIPEIHLCVKEIGLHAQTMIIISGSIVSMIGGDLYNHLMRQES